MGIMNHSATWVRVGSPTLFIRREATSGWVEGAMDIDEIREVIAAAARRIASSLDLQVVDVTLGSGGGAARLLVTVDKPGGVTVDDCAEMSEALSQWLDAADPLPGRYRLQVSSPGLDRPLRTAADFRSSVGRFARVVVRRADGEQTLIGTIRSVSGEDIELEDKAGRLHGFAVSEVTRARLEVDFGLGPAGKGGRR